MVSPEKIQGRGEIREQRKTSVGRREQVSGGQCVGGWAVSRPRQVGIKSIKWYRNKVYSSTITDKDKVQLDPSWKEGRGRVRSKEHMYFFCPSPYNMKIVQQFRVIFMLYVSYYGGII